MSLLACSPRPHLVTSLRDKLPNQCVTCGRRFPTGTEGKAQKEKHMDWHFRTNQRIQDASKGIQNRSWYIGEMVCIFLCLISLKIMSN